MFRIFRIGVALATFRRKIALSDRLKAPRNPNRIDLKSRFRVLLVERGAELAIRSQARATARAFPILMRLSARTPKPTQRFIPSRPR